MSRRFYCLFFVVGLLLAFLSPLAFAKKAKNKSSDFIQVVSVDTNKITVADQDGKDASTYGLTPLTTVIVDGQPGKLSDLRKGMHVDISLIEGGAAVGKIDASSVPSAKKKTS
jgi:hypothetical protein